ncbi:MAG: hypothetical protein AB7K09_12445 [Planctomycetota bacterium]
MFRSSSRIPVLILLALAVGSVAISCAAESSGTGSNYTAGGGSSTSPTPAGATEQNHRLDAMPASEEEFVALRDRMATTPQGAAVCFAVALIIYAENADLGAVAIARMLDRDQLDNSGDVPMLRAMDTSKLHRYVADAPNAVRSLLTSATPANSYEIGTGPWTLRTREQRGDVRGDTAKIFVFSTGADTPRPVSMKKNSAGLWKVTEWSSLVVAVRKPATTTTDNY